MISNQLGNLIGLKFSSTVAVGVISLIGYSVVEIWGLEKHQLFVA